jgi:hypothetical protein
MIKNQFALSDEQITMLVHEYKQYVDVYGIETFQCMINGFDYFVNNGLELVLPDEISKLTDGSINTLFFVFACGWEQCRINDTTVH